MKDKFPLGYLLILLGFVAIGYAITAQVLETLILP